MRSFGVLAYVLTCCELLAPIAATADETPLPAGRSQSQRVPTAPSASPLGRPQAMVRILTGPAAGKEFAISKPVIALGKQGGQIALIRKRPEGYFISYVDGGSFPVINADPNDPQARRLDDHEIIELSGIKVEFYLKP